jgi:hypothetical protein
MKRFTCQLLAILFYSITFLAFASSSDGEDQRQSRCGYLPEGQHCQESAKIFGSPPSESIVDDLKYEYCEEAKKCRQISREQIISASNLPPGSSINFHQKITITSKNGIEKVWNIGDGYGFEGEMKSSPYEIEFDTKHQYFWVQGAFYERRSSEWFSYLTGKAFSFEGETEISPDGDHLFEQIGQYDGEGEDSIIKIYAVTKENIQKQFQFDKQTSKKLTNEMMWGILPFWVNSNEIALLHRTDFGKKVVFARIIRKNGIWALIFEPAK